MPTVTHAFVSGIADNPQAAAAGEVLPSHWNANHVVSGLRTVLTANKNYYVSITGSDSNGGTNSSTDAWATLTHAMTFIASNLDFAGFTVTVNIGAGTFAGVGIQSTLGGGILLFLGAGVGSTIIGNGPNDGVFNFGEAFDLNVLTSAVVSFDALTIKLTAANNCTACYTPGQNFVLGNIVTFAVNLGFDFSSAGSSIALSVSAPSLATTAGSAGTGVAITGGNATGINLFSLAGGAIYENLANWALTGNITYSPACLMVSAFFVEFSGQFTGGTPSGSRFQIEGGSAAGNNLGTIGALGPSFFPGGTAGTVDASSAYDGFPGPLTGINTQTSNYILAIGDTSSIVEMNLAGANTVTVPTNASVAFEIGTKIQVTQIGAGATTVAASGGVTVHNAGALSGQWGSVMLYKRGTDEWVQTVA